MRILITGATGFIGSHVVRLASRTPHTLVCVRRTPAEPERGDMRCRWVVAELNHLTAEDFEGVDVVLHLAAAGVSPQPASWSECYRVNVLETLGLVRTALAAGVRRFVVTGTYAEYGTSASRYDLIPPDAPLEPIGPYASSKAAAGVMLAGMCREGAIALSYQRLFSVYGEGQFENNFWPSLRRAALAGADFSMTPGEQVRDFVAVEDVAARLLDVCNRIEALPGTLEIANLASGRPQRLRDFAEYWWSSWGAKGSLLVGAEPYRAGEVMRYVPLVDQPLPTAGILDLGHAKARAST